jgi:hypothetical protein
MIPKCFEREKYGKIIPFAREKYGNTIPFVRVKYGKTIPFVREKSQKRGRGGGAFLPHIPVDPKYQSTLPPRMKYIAISL